MSDLYVGDTVYVRNRGLQEGRILEFRASEEPGPVMAAVKFEDPRLPTDWINTQECLLRKP